MDSRPEYELRYRIMAHEFDRETILKALARLSDLLKEAGAVGEMCLLGGTVMVVVYKARPSTKDVDAIFEPTLVIRELARRVQEEMELPENWINDAAKGFISARHEIATGDLPQFESLRVTAPVPEYLFAMKCMASRIPADLGDRGDISDIRFLIRYLGLTSLEQALAILSEYYPEERIPPRARYVLEDIFVEPEESH